MVFDPTKAGKTICACGRLAETFGGQCDRCASLQMLGLDSYASQEQIESSYRTLVKVWHPDRFSSDPALRLAAEEKLKEINAAHDFLVSAPSSPPPDSTEPETVPRRSETPRPFQPDLEVEQSEEIEKILKRRHKSAVPGIMLKVGLAIGAVAVAALIWFAADAILSSNDTTARWWDQTKSDLARELHASKERIAPGSDKPQESSPEPASSTPTPPATPAPDPPAPRVSQSRQVSGPTHINTAPLKGAQPYVTAGLTPMEVLSALGTPTSSTGEKMLYGSSEIDFKNGQVAGWKIDPRSPIRIKLWPDSPPAPGLTTFGVGSTKSDVIAVQGTPTLFADNEFGYGSSLVFFQNGRVMSWKEDPASVRLRVPH